MSHYPIAVSENGRDLSASWVQSAGGNPGYPAWSNVLNSLKVYIFFLGGNFSHRGWWRTDQVAQGGCGCPIPGGIQSQAGCGSGQPGLLVGDAAHGRGVETKLSLWFFSTQSISWFYDSMIYLVYYTSCPVHMWLILPKTVSACIPHHICIWKKDMGLQISGNCTKVCCHLTSECCIL